MLYSFELNEFPEIKKFYRVSRDTVWQITEPEHILIFIEKGSCSITCDGETNICEPGTIYFIPANHAYIRKPVGDGLCTMHYIHFLLPDNVNGNRDAILSCLKAEKEETEKSILNGDISPQRLCTIFIQNKNTDKNGASFELLKKINLFSSRKQLTCALKSAVILSEILVNISQSAVDLLLSDYIAPSARKVPAKLKRAISYITANYPKKISLEDLSRHCSISKQQLIRYFKDTFNTTPLNYITDFRIARAKELLYYSPQLTIKEVAAELGFDNQHYFTRVFSKINNETPTQYRKRTHNYKEKTE